MVIAEPIYNFQMLHNMGNRSNCIAYNGAQTVILMLDFLDWTPWVYLVKHFHSSVDDLQLQELLSQVLDPEVDCPSIQLAQKQYGADENSHTNEIKQLVPSQPANTMTCQRGVTSLSNICQPTSTQPLEYSLPCL